MSDDREFFLKRDKTNAPYRDFKEHLEEYSDLLDFLVEKNVELRISNPENIYMPGAMMSEETAGNYYRTDYRARRGSAYNPLWAKELQEAQGHIRSREKASKDLILPLKKLREEFALTFFEELAILLALGLSMNINRRNLYAYIANDANLKHPTTGVLYCIYQMISEEQDLTILDSFVDKLGKMSVFFFRYFDHLQASI